MSSSSTKPKTTSPSTGASRPRGRIAVFASAAVMALLSAELPARAEVIQGTAKSWVLFAWETNRGWYFSLLPNTEHGKRWAEVNVAKVLGWDALRPKLKNLQPGERLSF